MNLVNFKVYIGKYRGIRVEYRRDQHKRGKGNQPLYNAIKKHGWDNFIFDTLHYAPKEKLAELERQEIARFDCNKSRGGWGYNLTDGGDGNLGWVPSVETRQNISEGRKGIKHTPEARQRMSETRKGRKYTTEHRQAISQGLMGHVLSPETRSKIGDGNRGNKHTEEFKKNHSIRFSGAGNPMFGTIRPEISERMSGKNNPMFGKTGENCPNIHPEYSQAKVFFFIELHAETDIKQKRLRFYEAFPDISRRTLQNWFRKWQAELEESTTEKLISISVTGSICNVSNSFTQRSSASFSVADSRSSSAPSGIGSPV